MSELLDAMRCYFAKIPSPSYYRLLAGHYAFPKNPDAVKRVLSGEYLFPRQELPDFNSFEREFGFPLPDVLKEFFLYYHPNIEGRHTQCPFPNDIDGFRTHESLSDDDLEGFIGRMRFCVKWFPNFSNGMRYIPIGYIDGYVDAVNDFIWMERSTGRIFFEWNKQSDGSLYVDNEGHCIEGNIYPKPIAESLTEFIRALEPYTYKNM